MKKYINAIANIVMEPVSLFPDEALIFVHTIRTDEEDPSKMHEFRCYCEVNVVGTIDGDEENPIDNKKNLQFKVRVTKLSDIKEEQLCIDLFEFEIDCSDEKLIEKDNYLKHINYRALIDVPSLKNIPCKGKYSLRVLVKENTDDKYEVQSTTVFNVI